MCECLASGREVHGHGFLSSRGSLIPVMTDLCSQSGDNNSNAEQAGLVYQNVKTWIWRDPGRPSDLHCMYLTSRGQSKTNNTAVKPPSTNLIQARSSRLYLTCGISEEVTDVRNDFTERQTLRSKPENRKHTNDEPLFSISSTPADSTVS